MRKFNKLHLAPRSSDRGPLRIGAIGGWRRSDLPWNRRDHEMAGSFSHTRSVIDELVDVFATMLR